MSWNPLSWFQKSEAPAAEEQGEDKSAAPPQIGAGRRKRRSKSRRHRKGSRKAHRKGSRKAHRKGSRKAHRKSRRHH